MSRSRGWLIGVLAMQVVAVILYPPTFFREDPQAAVLPPSLLLLFVLGLVALNTGVLTPLAGRVSLVFVQGINLVVRTMMFFPNLRTSAGAWDWLFVVFTLAGLALSWFAIVLMESAPPRVLLFVRRNVE